MISRVTLAVLMTVGIAGLATAQQDQAYTYTIFHRVHLRNGNCIDGDLVGKTDLQVTLKLSVGEIHIRRTQIDRIEFVKMKSYNEPAVIIDKKRGGSSAPQIAPPATTPKAEDPAAATADSADAVPSHISRSVVEAVDLAISIWKRTPSGERQELSDSLASLGAAAVPYLEFLLEKRAASTPLEPVAKAFASLEEERFIELSAKLIRSPNNAVRIAVVAGLAKTTSSRRLPVLLEAMEDSDPTVWKQAGELLITNAKSDADKRDLADLFAARIRQSRNNHGLAVALGKLGGRAAHDALWDLVNDSNETNRMVGLQGVAVMADPADGPRVIGLLRDTSENIRKAACLTIGKMRYEPAVADLVNLLSEQNEGLQKNACWALAEITRQPVPNKVEAWQEWWTNFGSKEPRYRQ